MSNRKPINMSDAQWAYKKEISNTLLRMAKRSERVGASFVSVCDLGEGKRAITEVRTESMSLAQAITSLAVKSGSNIDALITGIAHLVVGNNVPHQSAFLTRLGIDADPAKRDIDKLSALIAPTTKPEAVAEETLKAGDDVQFDPFPAGDQEAVSDPAPQPAAVVKSDEDEDAELLDIPAFLRDGGAVRAAANQATAQ